jgi:cupin fold WbuC family metalloprotein
VIALGRDAYDRPHRHLVKTETMIALEGEALYLQFDVDGAPTGRQRFSAAANCDGVRMLRTPPGEFHGLVVVSEWLVFCESALGPFDAAASEFAPWSPAPADGSAVGRYLADLRAVAARI